ncbi:hypothetical protein PGB90_005989 [Kerria lacca]
MDYEWVVFSNNVNDFEKKKGTFVDKIIYTFVIYLTLFKSKHSLINIIINENNAIKKKNKNLLRVSVSREKFR